MSTLTPDINLIAAESSNPLLEISPGVMVWTLVMFGITLFIMRRYVFGPVGAMIEKRRAQIADDLNTAEEGRRSAERLLAEYQERLEEARREADALRDRGRKDGERQGAELVTAAQEQRERVIQDAQVQIAAETRQAEEGIKAEVVDLALMAAEKVTRRTLTDDEHRRVIEEAIADADLSTLARSPS